MAELPAKKPTSSTLKPFEIGQDGLLKTALDDPVVLSDGIWEELRIFLVVAKLGSLQKASSRLGISKATISRHVKRLQDMMKVQLVISGKTGSKLTPDGISLAKSLSDLDHRVFSIVSNYRTNNREVEGTVRVSVTEGLAGVFLASKLSQFYDQWHKISVHLKTPINVASLKENRADIMIGFEPVNSSEISCEPLGFLHLIPIASEKYLKKYGVPSFENAENHIFVDSQFYQAKTGMWSDWQKLIVKGRVAADCDSSLSYASAILGGLGIGLLGNYTLADDTLKPVLLDIHVKVPMYLLGLTERLNARPVQIVRDWVGQQFSPKNKWFAPRLHLRPDAPTQFLDTMRVLLGERENS